MVEALCSEGRVALKIRRVDTARESMELEADLLKEANGLGVGPNLVGWSRNFVLMELVKGMTVVDWLDSLGPMDGDAVSSILRGVLLSARRLDAAGIDHGELSRAYKHLIVSGGVARIIDFESASRNRRLANVTSLTQFFFLNSVLTDRLVKYIELPERGQLLEALTNYKDSLSSSDFHRILQVCGL